jgi:hypothetical protein
MRSATRRCVRCRRDLPLSSFDDSLTKSRDGRQRKCQDCWRPDPRRGLSPRERFKSYIDYRHESGCWPWTGSTAHGGYGHFRWDGKLTGTHRVAWTIAYGSIPKDLCVLHRCDNPPCCRPDHLFLGTHAENGQDRAAKGRSLRRNGPDGRCKLSAADVAAIRARAADGERQNALAHEYGVSAGALSMIVRRRRWSS